jgi:hypothetical protein
MNNFSAASKKTIVGLILFFLSPLLSMDVPQIPQGTLQQIVPFDTAKANCFSQENRLLLETFFPDDSSATKIDRFGSFLGKCPNDILIPLTLGHGPNVWNGLRVVNKNFSVLLSFHCPAKCLMPFIHYLGHDNDKKSIIIQKLCRTEALCAWDNEYINNVKTHKQGIIFEIMGDINNYGSQFEIYNKDNRVIQLKQTDQCGGYTFSVSRNEIHPFLTACMARNPQKVEKSFPEIQLNDGVKLTDIYRAFNSCMRGMEGTMRFILNNRGSLFQMVKDIGILEKCVSDNVFRSYLELHDINNILCYIDNNKEKVSTYLVNYLADIHKKLILIQQGLHIIIQNDDEKSLNIFLKKKIRQDMVSGNASQLAQIAILHGSYGVLGSIKTHYLRDDVRAETNYIMKWLALPKNWICHDVDSICEGHHEDLTRWHEKKRTIINYHKCLSQLFDAATLATFNPPVVFIKQESLNNEQ